jgi:hypothetical protein
MLNSLFCSRRNLIFLDKDEETIYSSVDESNYIHYLKSRSLAED